MLFGASCFFVRHVIWCGILFGASRYLERHGICCVMLCGRVVLFGRAMPCGRVMVFGVSWYLLRHGS